MPVYGLTGGIASGKSTVANLLRSKGAVVIDADEVARELVAPGHPALAEIAARFGPSVLSADGALDRAALGRLIFSDEAARRDLNGILHPRIFEAIRDRLATMDPGAPVFVEAALLAETYSQAAERLSFAGLVVVDAPAELQVERLLAKGFTQQEAELRLAAQMSREDRLARATHVVHNSGSLEELRRHVERLWMELRTAGA